MVLTRRDIDDSSNDKNQITRTFGTHQFVLQRCNSTHFNLTLICYTKLLLVGTEKNVF